MKKIQFHDFETKMKPRIQSASTAGHLSGHTAASSNKAHHLRNSQLTALRFSNAENYKSKDLEK